VHNWGVDIKFVQHRERSFLRAKVELKSMKETERASGFRTREKTEYIELKHKLRKFKN
jgi:hypothetical protein